MKKNMRVYTIVFMVLIQGYCLAEENPFHLKEAFIVMDKTEENLFSTMKKELIKDAVHPTLITIDFKERGKASTSMHKTHTPQPSTLYTKAQKEKLIQIKKEKIIQKKLELEVSKSKKIAMDKALAAQKQREIQRLKKNKILDQWTQADVVDIDLAKEKQYYQQKLEHDYREAIKEVGAD